jgi:hypothetical protein
MSDTIQLAVLLVAAGILLAGIGVFSWGIACITRR